MEQNQKLTSVKLGKLYKFDKWNCFIIQEKYGDYKYHPRCKVVWFDKTENRFMTAVPQIAALKEI